MLYSQDGPILKRLDFNHKLLPVSKNNLSFISRGLDPCKKHGMDARVHPKDEDEVIPTRQMFDRLTQERQEERSSITRF